MPNDKSKQSVQCSVEVCQRKKSKKSANKFFCLPSMPKVFNEDHILLVKKRKDVWLKKIRQQNAARRIYICDRHFYTGKPCGNLDYDHPDWAPSMYLNNDPLTPEKEEALKEKLLKHQKRKKKERKEKKMQEKEAKKRERESESENRQRKKAKMDVEPGTSEPCQSNNVNRELSDCEESHDENKSVESTDDFSEEENGNCSDSNSPTPADNQVTSSSSLSGKVSDTDSAIIQPSHQTKVCSLEDTKQSSQTTSKQKNNNESSTINGEPCWRIINILRQNGKPYLVDGLGHKFGLKKKKANGSVTWCCTFRPRNHTCLSMVCQMGDKFIITRDHTCTPKPKLELNMRLHEKARIIAKEVKSRSAINLLRPYFNDDDGTCASAPKLKHVLWTFCTTRKKLRPPNPENLFFEIQQDQIPESFLRGDVIVDHSEDHRERHLIFGSEKQLTLLKRAKCWFLDRTCKLINSPFVELVSIHATYFVGTQKNLKQTPLLYVFMSSRKVKDYSMVFEKILEMLGNEKCVEEIVFNFKNSVLQALEEKFPSASLYGCPFQWSQTVLRKFKTLGLIPLYDKFEGVQKICSRMLALHLLPGDEIPSVFNSLKEKAGKLKLREENSHLLEQFFNYVEDTWIKNPIWGPDRWSVFLQPVMRLNTDAWHNEFIISLHLSIKEQKPIDFYTLVLGLFHKLTSALPKKRPDLQLLTQKQQIVILRKQSVKYLSFNLYKYWDSYDEEDLNALDLLKVCATVYIKNCKFEFSNEGDVEQI